MSVTKASIDERYEADPVLRGLDATQRRHHAQASAMIGATEALQRSIDTFAAFRDRLNPEPQTELLTEVLLRQVADLMNTAWLLHGETNNYDFTEFPFSPWWAERR